MELQKTHFGATGVNSRGYGKDRGVIWPRGIRPDGIVLSPGEEIISYDEYLKRLEKQA